MNRSSTSDGYTAGVILRWTNFSCRFWFQLRFRFRLGVRFSGCDFDYLTQKILSVSQCWLASYRTVLVISTSNISTTLFQATWCLIIILANVDRFSTFFHQLIHEKILYVYTTKTFHITCNTLLHYLVKFENPTLLPMTVTICLIEIYCEIWCNLPHKYCTNEFT